MTNPTDKDLVQQETCTRQEWPSELSPIGRENTKITQDIAIKIALIPNEINVEWMVHFSFKKMEIIWKIEKKDQ